MLVPSPNSPGVRLNPTPWFTSTLRAFRSSVRHAENLWKRTYSAVDWSSFKCCGMTFRVFSFGPSLCFLSVHLSCFSRVVAACDAYAPVVRLDCQTDHVVLLSRTQLSYAHARSTGSCANAREFSCNFSFDKRVNKTFLGVKIRFRVFFYSRSTICCCGR